MTRVVCHLLCGRSAMQRKTARLERSNTITLNKETIRVLSERGLRAVAAGGSVPDTTVLTTQP